LDANGHAVLSLSTLSAGEHNLTAVYLGDANFLGSTSPQLVQSIATTQLTATTTTVTSAPKSSVFGQAVTFTATVAGADGVGTPGGTVQFMDGTTNLGTVALSGGRASLATAALSVGPHSITALYLGDPNYAASASSALARTINKAAARTTLSASPSGSLVGQPITIKATVRAVGPGAGVPGGTVQFVDLSNGGAKLGAPVGLVRGTATLRLSTLKAGIHRLTAIYSGDGHFTAGRAAAAFTVTIRGTNGGGDDGDGDDDGYRGTAANGAVLGSVPATLAEVRENVLRSVMARMSNVQASPLDILDPLLVAKRAAVKAGTTNAVDAVIAKFGS
jgi:hypothetical protein